RARLRARGSRLGRCLGVASASPPLASARTTAGGAPPTVALPSAGAQRISSRLDLRVPRQAVRERGRKGKRLAQMGSHTRDVLRKLYVLLPQFGTEVLFHEGGQVWSQARHDGTRQADPPWLAQPPRQRCDARLDVAYLAGQASRHSHGRGQVLN